ncbi:hypothetical protein [Streptomyces sp. NPDC048612]|uniref:hypothetical protein n=1 Tax=Streptomyces sp. NPDC048612 TaxID=3365579 RepID=UPI00371259AA
MATVNKDLKTEAARRDRRTLKAVATVQPTSAGTAACKPKAALFDRASSARAPLKVRLEAAEVCQGCALAATCGFRVAMPYRKRAT